MGIGENFNRGVSLGALGEIITEGYPWGHWGKYQQRGIPEGIGGNTNRGVSPGALREIPTEGYPWGHWEKYQQMSIPWGIGGNSNRRVSLRRGGGNSNRGVSLGALGEIPTEGYWENFHACLIFSLLSQT